MSIRPDIEAWQRRFGACLLAALAALLLTGAHDLTQELHQRHTRLQQVRTQLSHWGRHLAGPSGLPAERDATSRYALFLVRTCAVPSLQP